MKTNASNSVVTSCIEYRTPFRFGELLDFFRARALQGVEAVGEDSYKRRVTMGTEGVVTQDAQVVFGRVVDG